MNGFDTKILLPGRLHTACDPMCGDCQEWTEEVVKAVEPLIAEVVDNLCSFLESRIFCYKGLDQAERIDLLDELGNMLLSSILESRIPPEGENWPDLRRRVAAVRWDREMKAARLSALEQEELGASSAGKRPGI
jgi:hypothetical protein